MDLKKTQTSPRRSAGTTRTVPVGDVTRTTRSEAYLERLGAAKGKRVVVDLNADEREALEGLVASGYAENQSGVIRKAIEEVAQRHWKT